MSADCARRAPPDSRRSAVLRHAVVLALAAALAPVAAVARPATTTNASAQPPVGRFEADRLAADPAAPARNARLAAWARDASLDDLLWVLRRDPGALAGIELVLVDAAIQRTAPARRELLRRLESRHLLLDPRAARRAGRDGSEWEVVHSRQSVFRIAVLLPDRGDYASYAASVRAGLEAGVSWGRGPGALPIELDAHGTGEGEIARGAAVLDTVSRSCGAVVGELLSVATSALAVGTRVLGLPLVSPTATDEDIGRIGPALFQVGPASALRGERLARAVLTSGPRKVAILTSSTAARSTFVEAFAAAAESLGATLVRRDTYAPGTSDFRIASRALRTFGAQVLLWDGESREADALVRQLAADGLSVEICGGSALAPEHFHAPARALLEGVTWVADDWMLARAEQARLDSLARAVGEKPSSLWTRGFLAGRRIAAAVDAGARTPSELAARLRHGNPVLRDAGFLDCAQDGAALPVYRVRRGKTIELEAP